MPAYRLPAAQEEICFLFCLLFVLSPARHIPLFNSHFASRSTPTKAKKVGVSESLTLLRALWWDASYACLAFSTKPENETARCRSLQIFPSARRSLQVLADPAAPAIKAVMRLHDCSPSVFTVSNPPFSSYDANVFCCQRDPFLDVQGPPSEPAFQLMGRCVSIPGELSLRFTL